MEATAAPLESKIQRRFSLSPLSAARSADGDLAVWDGSERDVDLVARADAALYEAKRHAGTSS